MNIMRSTWIVLAFGAAFAASAQITTVNGMKVFKKWWNDFPTSNAVETVNYPTSVSLTDNPQSTGSGYANRHLFMFSSDGGATEYVHKGLNDGFEVSMDVNVNSNAVSGSFPRRVEAGPFLRMPVVGGWVSEVQMIITSDGEVAAFGTPIPFYSFTTQQAITYTQGTTVKIGYRCYRDTDGKFKWVWLYGNTPSPALTMEGSVQGLPWDFTNKGIQPSYIDNGQPKDPNLGMYLQIMPNQGAPTQINASMAMTNIVVRSYGIKGNVMLNNITTNGEGEPITVDVVSSGTSLQSFTTTLDRNGLINMRSTVPAGTYDVYVRGATHITKKISNVVFSADSANFTAALINGDVNGDNEVGPADFTLLSGSFGKMLGDPGYLASADLNRDDEVGPADFTILSQNFGIQGD